MEPSSDRNHCGIVGIGGARVSGNGNGIVMESDDRVLRLAENGGIDMRLNREVSRSTIADNGNTGTNLVGLKLGGNVQSRSILEKEEMEVSEAGAVDAIDLVVDLNQYSRKGIDGNGSGMNAGVHINGVEASEKRTNDAESTEKEGEYEVLDLVWAKVKSHPWWPGQVFDPSASTDEARKYVKKDGFLIVYFGDQTFAWNEAFKLKPFRVNFCKMVKQSNAEAFSHAVDCALDEAARRVEYGLTCSCLSEEVYRKIKYQIIVNPGIREESSRVDGGDRFSTVASFKPAKIVSFVQDLAQDPFAINRLEVSIARAQLLAFHRWKGYYQLRSDQVLDGPENKFDIDSGIHSMEEEKIVDDAIPSEKVTKKGKSIPRGSVSTKHKHVFDGGFIPNKKVRCLSELMTNGDPSVLDGNHKTKQVGRKRKDVGSEGSREGIESQAADEFLSQVCLVAKNPMVKQHSLNSLLRFSADFRNYRMEANSQLKQDDIGVKQAEQNTQRSEATQVAGFLGIEDSYWTDRIIQIDPNEQVFTGQPKTSKENSPTALILKFSNLESIPPITNLNEIFSRYGPLQELETEVLKRNNCAKVVFERRPDAETAFSSSGKFSIFGPALVSYCLDYSPTPRRTPAPGRKQNKKGTKSAKAMQVEN